MREYAEDGVTYWYDHAGEGCGETMELLPADLASLGRSLEGYTWVGCVLQQDLPHLDHIDQVSRNPGRYVCWSSPDGYRMFEAPRCREDETVTGAPDLGADSCRLPSGHEGPHPW